MIRIDAVTESEGDRRSTPPEELAPLRALTIDSAPPPRWRADSENGKPVGLPTAYEFSISAPLPETKCIKPVKFGGFQEYPQRDSNPCRHLEADLWLDFIEF